MLPLTKTLPGVYSHFRVGCSILLKTTHPLYGTHITGANVENASYPVTTCAERVAFGTAVAAGLRPGFVRAIAVTTDLDTVCSPCGMCRQFIREFCDPDVPIFMFTRQGDVTVKTLAHVSPQCKERPQV
jgi:cytidine deaminase